MPVTKIHSNQVNNQSSFFELKTIIVDSTSSTSFVNISGAVLNFNITNASNKIVINGLINRIQHSLSEASTFFRFILDDSTAGVEYSVGNTTGWSFKQISLIDSFNNLSIGNHNIKIQWKVISGVGNIVSDVNSNSQLFIGIDVKY